MQICIICFRIQPDADPGSGSTLQPKRIHVTVPHHIPIQYQDYFSQRSIFHSLDPDPNLNPHGGSMLNQDPDLHDNQRGSTSLCTYYIKTLLKIRSIFYSMDPEPHLDPHRGSLRIQDSNQHYNVCESTLLARAEPIKRWGEQMIQKT